MQPQKFSEIRKDNNGYILFSENGIEYQFHPFEILHDNSGKPHTGLTLHSTIKIDNKFKLIYLEDSELSIILKASKNGKKTINL